MEIKLKRSNFARTCQVKSRRVKRVETKELKMLIGIRHARFMGTGTAQRRPLAWENERQCRTSLRTGSLAITMEAKISVLYFLTIFNFVIRVRLVQADLMAGSKKGGPFSLPPTLLSTLRYLLIIIITYHH